MKLHQIVRQGVGMSEPKDAYVGEGAKGDEDKPTRADPPEVEDEELKEIDDSDTTPTLGEDLENKEPA